MKGTPTVRTDAKPSHCEVTGCEHPATHSYLHAAGERLVEFGLCADHNARLQRGARPLVVAERFDLADLDGRTVLVLALPDDADSD